MDLTTYSNFSIGLDKLFSEIEVAANINSTGFPPYNIYRVGKDNFIIEIAIAGYLKEDISITQKECVLLISSIKEPSNLATFNWQEVTEPGSSLSYKVRVDNNGNPVSELHKGITGKRFNRKFQLAEHVKVNEAIFNEGILTIYLEQVVPEEKKIKTIKIN